MALRGPDFSRATLEAHVERLVRGNVVGLYAAAETEARAHAALMEAIPAMQEFARQYLVTPGGVRTLGSDIACDGFVLTRAVSKRLLRVCRGDSARPNVPAAGLCATPAANRSRTPLRSPACSPSRKASGRPSLASKARWTPPSWPR